MLVHRGQQIFESAIINEYLEEVLPRNALMPNDPAQRADLRFWVNFVHDRLVSAYFNLMNSNDPAQWAGLNEKLGRWFRFVEDRAFADVWICGKTMSLTDLSLYPWIERFVSVERYRGGSIPQDCVKLAAWVDAMRATSAVTACAKTTEHYVTYFDRYWTPLEAGN